MKYLSIYRFAKHYISSILGKLEGFLITPLVFPHRDWIRNYAWNYMIVNEIECLRSTIHSEDDTKYYTKNGFILKRKTNKVLGKAVFIILDFQIIIVSTSTNCNPVQHVVNF